MIIYRGCLIKYSFTIKLQGLDYRSATSEAMNDKDNNMHTWLIDHQLLQQTVGRPIHSNKYNQQNISDWLDILLMGDN